MTEFKLHSQKALGLKAFFVILLFIAILLFFVSLIDDFSQTADENGKKSLEAALKRNITYCYAIEGTYPESLKYIKDHYGLIYDEKKYFVDYKVIGSNIYPIVSIVELRKE